MNLTCFIFYCTQCLEFLLKISAEVFDDVKVAHKNIEEFPLSPIILATCSPHQPEIGNNLILDLLLKYNIGDVDMRDNKGTCIVHVHI